MTRAIALGTSFLFFAAALPTAATLAAFSLVLAPRAAWAAKIITVGTGGVTGVYFPAGGAICRLVNQTQRFHDLRCLVESTAGSVDNTRRVLEGTLEFAIVQSDVQWKAVRGAPPFERPAKDLRSVMSLYPETAVLAVARGSGIESPADLRGKRLNLGAPGSGTRATAEDALAALGIAESDLAWAGDLGLEELHEATREGRMDAFFLLAGHPSEALKALLSDWDARLIPLAGAPLAALIAGKPYYVAAEIPGGLYPGVETAVPTFAVKATLVTSADISQAVVYNVTKAVLIAADRLRALHPALAAFRKESALEGLVAPLHPGACRYYREAGLGCPE